LDYQRKLFWQTVQKTVSAPQLNLLQM
jgi:hypothetical protein